MIHLVLLPAGKIFIPTNGVSESQEFDYYDRYRSEWVNISENALVIDPFKEFAVLKKPKLPSERKSFVAIYFSSYVYVMGGKTFKNMSILPSNECDRFDCRTNCWESLPPLPQECYQAAVVETNNCLFVLGGIRIGEHKQKVLKVEIQQLNLNSLEWDVLPIKLPSPAVNISCFSRGSEVYFVVYGALYSFAPDSINFIQNVSSTPYAQGPSYLYKTTLFCTSLSSPANIFELGEIEAFRS